MNNQQKSVNSPEESCYITQRGKGFTKPVWLPGMGASMMTEKEIKIVVIDDSPASITMYRRAADNLDVNLSSFESPREGFEHLRGQRADLIFLGNLMRETDGLSLLRKVRELEHHSQTPVVVMSTKDYDQDRQMARTLGAMDYLVKPVRSQEIRDVIEKYTGARERPPS